MLIKTYSEHRFYSTTNYWHTTLFVILLFSTFFTPGHTESVKPILRVGSEIDFPPYAIVDTKGQASGFSVELAQEVATMMDIPVTITAAPWNEVLTGFKNRRFDLLPLVMLTPQRATMAAFTKPHTISYDSFAVRSGSSYIHTLAQAQGKTVIVMNHDVAHEKLLDSRLPITIIPVPTISAAMRLLAAGKYDTVLAPKLIAHRVVRELGLATVIDVGPPIADYQRKFAFAVQPENAELRDKLEQGIAIVKATGRYDELYETWFGSLESKHLLTWTELSFGLSISSIILIVTLAWILMLRWQVARRTMDLRTEIDERRKTEALLREGEAQLRYERDFSTAIINGLPGIFYAINRQHKFNLWNKNFEEVIGYTAAEIPHLNSLDLFEHSDKMRIKNKIDNVFINGPDAVEATLITKDGRRIPYHFTGQRLDIGANVQLIGVGLDISAHRRMEAMLSHANAELERFAEISAHHLMEPTRRLVSFSQRLRASLVGRIDTPDALIALDFIEQQANRLRALLRDIQLYLVADRSWGETEAVNAGQIVQTLITQLTGRIQHAAATVTIGTLPPALIDKNQLANIFTVLLINALEHCSPDRPGTIKIDGRKNGTTTQYRVIDNGMGIPVEFQERVFRVFERLHPKPGEDSTGIGLSIVRRIVIARNGKSWIEDTPGGGTTVVIELPSGETS